MLQIAIRDTDKTPTWSLPGTLLFLSFEAPGPIDVDIQALSLDQKKILAQDISRTVLAAKGVEELHAVIVGSNTNDPVYKGGTGSTAKSYAKVRMVRDEEGHAVAFHQKPLEVAAPFDPLEDRKHALSGFLEKHVATVKKELPGKSLSELRILRDLEAKDKNRASVLKMIDTLISKAQSEVFNSIQKDYNPSLETRPSTHDLPRQYLDNVTSVVESEAEEVTIKLGADDND